ncbi:MAG: hypothetical protein ACM65L_20000 [Microcoleus sp.]
MGLEQDRQQLSHPEKLNLSHQIDSFNSDNNELNEWLKRRALKNELEGASRTYVVCAGQAEELRLYYEEKNRDLIARIAAQPPQPGTEAAWEKLRAAKAKFKSEL